MNLAWRKLAFLLLFMSAVLFQNCGDSFESVKVASVTEPPIVNPSDNNNEEVLYSRDLTVDQSMRQFNFSLIEIEENETMAYELRIVTSPRNPNRVIFAEPVLENYLQNPPQMAHLAAPHTQPVHAVILSDNGRNLLMLRINTDETIESLWQIRLDVALDDATFKNLFTSGSNTTTSFIVLNDLIINGSTSNNPVQQTCNLANNEIVNGICQGQTRACSIADGMGVEQWTGNDWGPCQLVSCNTGYHSVGNTCEPNILNCNDGSPGSVGQRIWNSVQEQYSTCVIVECQLAGYHLESDTCMADAKSCTVENGQGEETWDPLTLDYGACTVTSCNAGYANIDNVCVVSQTSCPITNGTGRRLVQSDGTYGECEVESCDNGYEVVGNQCLPTLDGSRIEYVQASGFVAGDLRNLCNSFQNMVPVGCLTGRLREANAEGRVIYGYGTEGEFSNAGDVIFTSGTTVHYCYSTGQEQTRDVLDIVVGIKCSNVPNTTLTYFGLPEANPDDDDDGVGNGAPTAECTGTDSSCRACTVDNGEGIQYLADLEQDIWSECQAQSCDAGYEVVNDDNLLICAPEAN